MGELSWAVLPPAAQAERAFFDRLWKKVLRNTQEWCLSVAVSAAEAANFKLGRLWRTAQHPLGLLNS